MTVQEFKKKAYGIDNISFYYKDMFYLDRVQFDDYIITEFHFGVNYAGAVSCTLDIVEPQK